MTYYKKRRIVMRKPKDILSLALRNLWPGEEIICTKRTYDAVKDRLKSITDSYADRRIETIKHGATWKIWRTA